MVKDETECLLGKSEIAGSSPTLAFTFQRNKTCLPRSLVKIGGSPSDREVACSASDRQGANLCPIKIIS